MRGFLPAVATLLLGVFSTGMWIMWQGPGAVPLRVLYGGGIVMLAWHDPANPASIRRGLQLGPGGWYLSVMYTDSSMSSPYRGWLVTRPLWTWKKWRFEMTLRLHWREIQIPLVPLGIGPGDPARDRARVASMAPG
jgi:hypothetical protein